VCTGDPIPSREQAPWVVELGLSMPGLKFFALGC
jgi:hypothetical protein